MQPTDQSRRRVRIVGAVALPVGMLLVVAGVVWAMTKGDEWLWLAFAGMPLVVIGSACLWAGFRKGTANSDWPKGG